MNEAKSEIRTSEAIRNIRTAMLLFLLEVKIFGCGGEVWRKRTHDLSEP